MRRYCKHEKSLLSKSRKSKLTSCVVSGQKILPVSDSFYDVYLHFEFMTTFVGLRSDLL